MKIVTLPVESAPSFRLIPLSELCRDLKGPRYLIKPFLETDCVGVWYGDSDTYKSFLMLDVSLCIAHGVAFFGHPVHQHPVVYVIGEGKGGFARRVEAWRIHRGIKDDAAPFYLSNIPAQLIDEGNAMAIGQTIKETADNPGLIVIDTLSTNMGDGDESSNTDVARLLNNVGLYLREQTHACIVIVHHVGHGEKGRERGAYALRGNTDFRALVTRCQPPESRICSVQCMKMKDGAAFEPFSFQADVVQIPGLVDSEGEPVTSLALSRIDYVEAKQVKDLPQRTQQCLAALKDLHDRARENMRAQHRDEGEAQVETSTWKEQVVKLGIVKGKNKRSTDNQFHRIRRGLIDDDMVVESGAFSYLKPATATDNKLTTK